MKSRFFPVSLFFVLSASLLMQVGCGNSGGPTANAGGSAGHGTGGGAGKDGGADSPGASGAAGAAGTGGAAAGGQGAGGATSAKADVSTADVAAPDASAPDAAPDGPARVPTKDERTAAKQAIEAFIESRNLASPPPATELAGRLSEQGFTADDVEGMVRSGPLSYPVAGKVPDGDVAMVSKLAITCYHANYSATYFLYVPKSYTPTRPNALVVIGHGGNSAMSTDYAESTADQYIDSYRDLADGALGAILVAPATTVGWGLVGDDLIESVISKTIRDYAIDPDRIYITGQSMGGHLTWRSAMNHGDRYAAFSPQSGGYASYIDDHLIENVFGTVGYVTYGTIEPYDLDITNDLLGAWLTGRHYPWTIVKKDGGHEIYGDEIPKVGALFAASNRNLYPSRTFLHGVGELRYPNAATPTGEAIAGRTMRWNFRNWMEVDPRPDLAAGVTFYGENKGGGRLEIQSNGVRHMNVLLHPKMVDLTANVTIVVNGEVKYAGRPATDLGQLLDRVREFDDRGRIFHASIPVDVSSDVTVPVPTYP